MADGQLDADETAVRLALAGDDFAWHGLVEKYQVYLYRLAWRVTLNEEDAMDAVQETFLKVAKGLYLFKNRGTFRAWLTTISIREAITISRRQASGAQAVDPQILADLIDQNLQSAVGQSDAAKAIDRSRRIARIHEAMQKLSPQQRAILLLGISNDFGPGEIARELGLPANQVRSQWARGVVKLREIMQVDSEPAQRTK